MAAAAACVPTPVDDDDIDDDEPPLTVEALRASVIGWGDGEGPSAREHGAMVVSADGSTIFAYGGSGFPQEPDNVLDDG